MIPNMPTKATYMPTKTTYKEQMLQVFIYPIAGNTHSFHSHTHRSHPLNLSFVASFPLQISQLIKAHLGTLLENQIIAAQPWILLLFICQSFPCCVCSKLPIGRGRPNYFLSSLSTMGRKSLGVPTLIC